MPRVHCRHLVRGLCSEEALVEQQRNWIGRQMTGVGMQAGGLDTWCLAQVDQAMGSGIVLQGGSSASLH